MGMSHESCLSVYKPYPPMTLEDSSATFIGDETIDLLLSVSRCLLVYGYGTKAFRLLPHRYSPIHRAFEGCKRADSSTDVRKRGEPK